MTNSIDSGIDKYDGSFEREESGCTILINETVQKIKKLEVAGLYLYLMCRPPKWKLNVKHLASYFGCNKDKIYAIIDSLIDLHLLTRTEIRSKGKFVEYKYRAHLRQIISARVQNAPVLEKPDTVKPDTENPDAYKTKNVENKESIKERSNNNCAAKLAHENLAYGFDKFWELTPIKKNKLRAKRLWEKKRLYLKVEEICNDLVNRIKHDSQWKDKQYIPHPSTYLANELWTDEITTNKPKQSGNGGDALSRVLNKVLNGTGATYDHATGNTIDPLR